MVEKYIMYLRKSRADSEYESVEQVLERHETILQEYAAKTFGSPIPESNIYREVVSGETICDRPMINIVLTRIQNENLSGVLVVEPQRLSRGDLRDCGTIIRAFQYTNTLVVTPQKTYDLGDKFDRKFFEMELMRGNDYLEYVKEIIARGRLASVKEGNYIGSGSPYGYDKVKSGKHFTLAPNSEADAVRLIFDLFVNQGMKPPSIARHLDSLGIKPKKKDFWSEASIRDILQNPVYIGKIRWNWRKSVKKYVNGEITATRPKADKDTWIIVDGKHPGIVPEELFDEAQGIFGKGARLKKGYPMVNPFSGIIRCECGSAMVMKQSSRYSTRLVCREQRHCKNKSALYSSVLEQVVTTINECIKDFTINLKSGEDAEKKSHENTIKKLKKDLEKLEARQERLYDLLEEGTYTKELFEIRNDALAKSRKEILEAISFAESKLNGEINIGDKIVRFSEALEALQSDEVPAEVQNKMLKSVINSMIYSCPRAEKQFKLKINLKL